MQPVGSHNAADSIQWKFRVSNITKRLECAHSMKLKEYSVFDCYNKVKLAAPLTLKTAAPWQRHLVQFLRCQDTEFVVKFVVITIRQTLVPITVSFVQNLNSTLVPTQLGGGTKKYQSLLYIPTTNQSHLPTKKSYQFQKPYSCKYISIAHCALEAFILTEDVCFVQLPL